MMPQNPVVGSTVLRRPAIQSPNFAHNISGWTINADGSAEFDNLVLRGSFHGTDYVINSVGAFFYSPSEAAGNLVISLCPAATAGPFGESCPEGLSVSAPGVGTNIIQIRPDKSAMFIYAP